MWFHCFAVFLEKFLPSAFISVSMPQSTNIIIKSSSSMGVHVLAILPLWSKLNIHHLLPFRAFFFSYKAPEEQMIYGSRFYQKMMQWNDFCIHFVELLYKGSEPIGSQWGGVPSVKEDSNLWYFTVCNFLLCVILIDHFIFIHLSYIMFLECEWLTDFWYGFILVDTHARISQAL